jgi:hypothetical protein
MHPAFAGSKRKRRRLAKETAQTNADLATLYSYARLIRSEDELDTFLAAELNDERRAEIKSLMEPMVLFKYRTGPRVILASELDAIDLAASPEKATRVTLT